MSERYSKKNNPSTSWEPVEKWYKEAVGNEGLYYHKNIILPKVMDLIAKDTSSKKYSVLDLACGQGILARYLPEDISYTGIDLSASLIKAAKQNDQNPLHQYEVGDITKPLAVKKKDFNIVTIILALQNVEDPKKVFENAFQYLQADGKMVIVLNHPCFRIPRQSSWGVDKEKKIQYRRLDRYMSPMRIPIDANPSKGKHSEATWSFHHSLSDYSRWLHEKGFVITLIDEWCSDKVSVGGAAQMENRSRAEFPLFCMLFASKG